MPNESILIVDDEPDALEILSDRLEMYGYDIRTAHDGEEALERLQEECADLVLLDIQMPILDGMGALRKMRRRYPGILVVMLTAHGTIELAVEAMKLGALDFVRKPFDQELATKINNALRQGKPQSPNRQTLQHAYDEIIGESEGILNVLAQIEQVADTNVPVLIQGETGTGKELVAQALHHKSRRANQQFVTINCGAIPQELMESELFGHERGSFTGATNQRLGKMERAHLGTLFLDEIGDMPHSLQVKLLRAIEEQRFERVGGDREIQVDVRVIAATHRNLPSAIQEGSFREDLYFRLNLMVIALPPLRERTEDIPLLAEHFLRQFSEAYHREARLISQKALRLLNLYSWPGNVRELNNVLGRAVLSCKSEAILPEHLPDEVQESSAETLTPVGTTLEQMERDLILRTLEELDGNRTQTAKLLGISLRALQYKLKEYDAS